MKSWFNTCIVLLLVAKISTSQISDDWNVRNSCASKVTCAECIQTNNCSWCMEPLMDSKPRCFYSSLAYCKKESEWNPKNEQQILSMRELTRVGHKFTAGTTVNEADIVQISPQNISLKLRINEEHRINWQYKEVEDYPLDVYFLMDLSKSMENDKEKLLKLGNLLANSIPNITSNFRLGFGSFVDKSVMRNHVAGWSKSNLYEFKNHMSLGTNTTQFTEQLLEIAVSNNPVAQGGGLEALMQAVVCGSELRWRQNARRILVFSTNSGFRYAEDNVQNAVIPPNDGQCHMDASGMYAQDYPSVTQINSKIRQTHINVIFAVTSSQSTVYENLSYQVEGSSSAVLAEDSSNVLELIRDEYSKISSTVEMKDTSPSVVEITYSSSTSWQFEPIQSNIRYGIKVGDVVNFSADIVITSCPKHERDWKQIFQIYPVGLNQRLIVNLEILCSCPCENNSAICESSVRPERSTN